MIPNFNLWWSASAEAEAHRWRGDTSPAMAMGPALTRMTASARKFKVDSVREQDLALVGAVMGGED